ncbi:MAG: murein biosynthesis integral membrane protein MurJ [Thermodesulfobacteriota bacterium]
MKNLFKKTLLVGFIGFISRTLGLVRDILIATVFGAGLQSDAFFVSFKGFDVLRKLYSEGVLSSSFIPVFARYEKSGGREKALEMANSAFFAVSVISVLIMAAGMVFAPLVVRIIAPGFDPASYSFSLSVLLFRVMMPYTVFIALTGVCMGVLNSAGSFSAPAFAPVVLNLCIILFTMMFADKFDPPVLAVASGVSAGGLLQLGLQIQSIRRSGNFFRTGIRIFHPGAAAAGKRLFPAIIGASACHINMIIAVFLGSCLYQGGISYLYYADRLVQFPVALISASFSIVFLPALSRKAVSGGISDAGELLSSAARLVLFFTIPAAAGLAALRIPLVDLLYHHGAFNTRAAVNTSECLLFLVVGAWAFAGTRLFVNIFYAFSDMKIPFRAGVLSILIHIALSLLMLNSLGYKGLALSVSISGTVNFLVLLIAACSFAPVDLKKIFFSACRAIPASVIMYFSVSIIADYLFDAKAAAVQEIMLLAGSVFAGILIYLAVQAVLKSPEIDLLKHMIRKT